MQKQERLKQLNKAISDLLLLNKHIADTGRRVTKVNKSESYSRLRLIHLDLVEVIEEFRNLRTGLAEELRSELGEANYPYENSSNLILWPKIKKAVEE